MKVKVLPEFVSNKHFMSKILDILVLDDIVLCIDSLNPQCTGYENYELQLNLLVGRRKLVLIQKCVRDDFDLFTHSKRDSVRYIQAFRSTAIHLIEKHSKDIVRLWLKA